MGKCIVFCAAEFDALLQPVKPEDFVIAADGGLRHTQSLGLTPNEIIGDFDSLSYIPQGAHVFPVMKDDTDSMLAVRRGLELGFRDFVLYGAMDGPRLDHTVANFQTLQFLADRGARGILAGRDFLATVIREEAVRFPAGTEGGISLFCLGPDAEGVTLEGLLYPLENAVLTSGFPLGVSNHFTGAEARIRVDRGSLLALWERPAGLPEQYR